MKQKRLLIQAALQPKPLLLQTLLLPQPMFQKHRSSLLQPPGFQKHRSSRLPWMGFQKHQTSRQPWTGFVRVCSSPPEPAGSILLRVPAPEPVPPEQECRLLQKNRPRKDQPPPRQSVASPQSGIPLLRPVPAGRQAANHPPFLPAQAAAGRPQEPQRRQLPASTAIEDCGRSSFREEPQPEGVKTLSLPKDPREPLLQGIRVSFLCRRTFRLSSLTYLIVSVILYLLHQKSPRPVQLGSGSAFRYPQK